MWLLSSSLIMCFFWELKLRDRDRLGAGHPGLPEKKEQQADYATKLNKEAALPF